jgi:XTP/dITP diphosphohydrolase
MRLLLASNNAGKLAELRDLLGGLDLELVAQGTLAIPEAAEPYGTFIENALAKARHAAAAAGGAAIADDSGLCVDALGGAPGVNSAHYAPLDGAAPTGRGGAADGDGRPGDREALRRAQDAANNALLLQRLQGSADRSAHFVSTLVALRDADDAQPLVAVGRWPGRILQAGRGDGGFGYDPLMYIPELGCAVAEMGATLKNAHSHRARAMAQMRALLVDVWRL